MNLYKTFIGFVLGFILIQVAFASKTQSKKTTYLDYDNIEIYTLDIGLIKVKKDKKWGFVDKNGNKVIDTIYDKVYNFKNNLAIAQKDKKFGVINTKGEIIVPFIYEELSLTTKDENIYLAKVDDKQGLINKLGDEILPIEYKSIYFEKDSFKLYKDSKYGLASKQRKIIIPVAYEDVKNISENYALVRVEGRWHFFDKNQQKLFDEAFDKVDKVVSNFIKVRQKGDFYLFNGLTRKQIVPSEYTYEGVRNFDLIAVKKDGKYGLFDKGGKLVAPAIYDDISYFDKTKSSKVLKNKLIGMINIKGKEIIAPIYIKANVHSLKNYFLFQSKDKKWHIFDLQERKDGKLKEIGNGFDNVSFAKDNKIVVQKNSKWILIDKNNPKKALQTYNYDYIKEYSCNCDGEADNYLIVKKAEKYGLIKPDGQVLIKPIYDSLSAWTTVSVKVKENGKYGVVDFKGNVVLKPTYDRLNWLYGMSAIAIGNIGDKWQLLDIYSKPISKLYNKVFLAVDGDKNLIIMDNKTKFRGVINNKGKELFDTKYKAANSFSGDNIELVNTKGETAYFDENAKQIVPFMKNIHKTVEDGMLLVKKYEEKYSRKIKSWWIYDIKTGKVLFTNKIKGDTNEN